MRFPFCRYSLLNSVAQRTPNLDIALKGLCYSGRLLEAVEILCSGGSSVETKTYALLLQESIHRKEYFLGRRIHSQMTTAGFIPDEYIRTKLLILYAKDGDFQRAHKLFDGGSEVNAIPWNAMISGYVQNNLGEEALDMFNNMRLSGCCPDQFTFSSVFRACARVAKLEFGRGIHGVMVKTVSNDNLVVNSAMIDMYFKCGSPQDGRLVFDCLKERNIVTWTALISGYSLHGDALEVLSLFQRLIDEGFRPNHITFLAVISACSRRGLVSKGWEYFNSMSKDYGIRLRREHYATMVNLLGRVGKLNEAYKLVKKASSENHPVMWGALLGSCRVYGNWKLMKLASEKFFKLVPDNVGKFIVLSNIYADLGMWDAVKDVRETFRVLGMKKDPGWSSIDIQGKVHTFLSGDKYHEQTENVEETARRLVYALTEMDCFLSEQNFWTNN